jgi:hypothetical protein
MNQVIEFTSAALKVSAMEIASVSLPVSLLVISLPELSAMMLPLDKNKITHTYTVDNYYFRAPFLAFIQFIIEFTMHDFLRRRLLYFATAAQNDFSLRSQFFSRRRRFP